MAKRSVTEESLVYRLLWDFFINSLPYLTLFAFVLYFYLADGITATRDIIALLGSGIIIELLISISTRKYAALFANLFPFILTLFGFVVFAQDDIYTFAPFISIFLSYSLLNSIGQELLFSQKPLLRSVSFIMVQIIKVAALLANMVLLESVFSNDKVFAIKFFNFSSENSFINIYLIINLIAITLSFLIIILQLIYRNTSLSIHTNKLKQISSWSLDQNIIEEHLVEEGSRFQYKFRTILIGDIRGFSSFSERQQLNTVVTVLEDLYQIVETVVSFYHGFKPEFIADEFITFFEDNKDAMDCAIELNYRVNEYLGDHDLSVGMGLDRGNVIEGIFGGHNSKKYTVLGRSVNIAARLQGKAEGGEILATGRVVVDQANLEKERIEDISLKNVKRKVAIYKISGYKHPQKPRAKVIEIIANARARLAKLISRG